MWSKMILLTVFIFTFGCSGKSTRPAQGPASTEASARSASDESLEITYALGHSHRRVRMEEHDKLVLAESWVEHNQLKKGAIPLDRFHDYLNQVSKFVDKSRSLASANNPPDSECRAPYVITLQQSGAPAQTLSGCRQENDSSFNQLVNHGEFLLFSSK